MIFAPDDSPFSAGTPSMAMGLWGRPTATSHSHYETVPRGHLEGNGAAGGGPSWCHLSHGGGGDEVEWLAGMSVAGCGRRYARGSLLSPPDYMLARG